MSQARTGIHWANRVLPIVEAVDVRSQGPARHILAAARSTHEHNESALFTLDERRSLFRRFIEVDDEHGAIRFVRENGPLIGNHLSFGIGEFENRLPRSLVLAAPANHRELVGLLNDTDAHVVFDRLDTVLANARAMRATWNLWLAVRAENLAKVSEVLRWSRVDGAAVPFATDANLAAGGGYDAPERPSYADDDAPRRDRAGRLYPWLPSLDEIAGSPLPSLTPSQKLHDARRWIGSNLTGALANNVRVSVEWSDATPVLHLYASCLLAGLWLQLHRAIAAGADFRVCACCGGPFEVSALESGRRRDARFCSDACKSRNQRRKNERIQELHRAGMSPTQISEATGAAPSTVRRATRAMTRPRGAQ